MRAPLNGKTVVVTRPKEQSSEMRRLLERLGARVIVAPSIRIVNPSSWKPLDGALRRLESYDIVIFTSANGAVRFFDRAAALRIGKLKRPKRLYAIGPKTALALKARGWKGVCVPEIHEGEALARFIARPRGARVLIARALVARDALPNLLRRRGAAVDAVETYRTVADARGARAIRRIVLGRAADFVTFTSSSTVDRFVKAAPPSAVRAFFKTAGAASIGPITSATLRRHGIEPVVQARPFTSAGLVAALARLCQATKK